MRLPLAALFSTLLASLVLPAYATDLTSMVDAAKGSASVTYTSVKNITIRYGQGSSLSSQLNGVTERIQFSQDGTGPDMTNLVSVFNNHVAKDKNSQARIYDAQIEGMAKLSGGPEAASFSYKITTNIKMANTVLSNDPSIGTVVDASWRDLYISEPMVLDTQYGKVDINSPLSTLATKFPEVASKIGASDAAHIFKDPMLDFRNLGVPISKWHTLEADGTSYFSLGESSFQEGTFEAKTESASAVIDGSTVQFTSQMPPPSAHIQVSAMNVTVVPEFPTSLALIAVLMTVVVIVSKELNYV